MKKKKHKKITQNFKNGRRSSRNKLFFFFGIVSINIKMVRFILFPIQKAFYN